MRVFHAAFLLLTAVGAGAETAQTGVRAQVLPVRAATIGAPMAGRITELPLKDGERFPEGAPLLRLDCRVEQSRLAKARATLALKRKVAEVSSRLVQLGSVSGLEAATAEAEVGEAEADVALAQAVVDRCSVRAPFAGRVAEVVARRWQHIQEGAPVYEVLDDSALEVVMVVPSRLLGRLQPGTAFTVAIEETGRQHGAVVVRTAGRIDPVSQSITVWGSVLSEAAAGLMPGMSGQVQLPDE